MLLRGHVPRDQLQFDSEIEKTAQNNRRRKKRSKQGEREEPSASPHRDIQVNQEEDMAERDRALPPVNQEKDMAERDRALPPPPPRRTLGNYAMQQGPRHFSSIAMPATTQHVEMKAAFLNLISANQFTGMDNKDPYSHLATFYELVGIMGFEEGDTEYAYLCLFPFSLAGKAKKWLRSHHPNQSLTSWNDVEEKFMHRVFPLSRFIKAKSDISTFRQGSDEAFCDAWEHFKVMLRKCPNHGLKDIAQLTIFHNGLRLDTKMILDAAAGGTMMDVDVEQVTRIIVALASTDYQAQHDRQVVQKNGMLDLSTSDVLLA